MPNLGSTLKNSYEQIKPIGANAPILVSQKGTVLHYPENQCDTKRGEKEVQIKD